VIHRYGLSIRVTLSTLICFNYSSLLSFTSRSKPSIPFTIDITTIPDPKPITLNDRKLLLELDLCKELCLDPTFLLPVV
jgi:sporulation-control protein spo0M